MFTTVRKLLTGRITLKPKLLIEDVTEFAAPHYILTGLVKMEHVYIFDDDVRVHCASLTASLECEFLYVAYHFRDDVSDEDREKVYDFYEGCSEESFAYFPTNWKHIIDLDDEDGWPDPDGWEECIEYYRCNCAY